MIKWSDEIESIKSMLAKGVSLKDIAEAYGVSKQRIYQVTVKFNVETINKQRSTFLKGKPVKYYWLNDMLCRKKFTKAQREHILKTLHIPDTCPALGIKLNYSGTGEGKFSAKDNSPSIDRIDSSKGYEVGNIHIISWRANRIKNDSTPDELLSLYKYLTELA